MSYQTENEQIEVMGDLWKKHWIKFILVAVIIAGFIYGYRTWKSYQHSQNEEAASLYLQLTKRLEHLDPGKTLTKDQIKEFHHVVDLLEKNHARNSYTQYARLLAAKQAVDENKSTDAEQLLHSVIKHAQDDEMKTLATIRLATIMIKNKKDVTGAQKSLDLLQAIPDSGTFKIAREDALGDSYYVLGQKDSALNSYKNALSYAKKEGVERPFIKMKLDNLEQTKGFQK